jgi:hypothetical protein
MTHAASQHQSPEMRRCIERCQHCHDSCMQAVTYCLEQGGAHAERGHVALLLDCAQMCHTTGDAMLRGSDAHHLLCDACADVAERCARSCEQFSGDQQMQACARECRRCAGTCTALAGR